MVNTNQVASLLTEKQILQDSLLSQKQITGSYNIYAGECVNTQLRTTMLDILKDEHCIQADLFSDMQSRGWYKVDQADQQKIQQAKQQLSAS